jgi:hypothetical protein
MTEPITSLPEAVADRGALPMPAGSIRPIEQLDVPLTQLQADLRQLVARQRVEASVERLRWMLAHPETATAGRPATPGDSAEMRHLLYDADADATVPAFPYPAAPKEA